ncbi:hypothetical protein [Salinisphaera sp. Q1T1-3]|uniref:hypothetical protein n=1 Tax=Salinisphaera sp. Q1T1-3 TaxID=2321229 RepID=UPI0011C36B0B|nr:hypothetical protein [Salinisphaera sp. Q1T1-3]
MQPESDTSSPSDATDPRDEQIDNLQWALALVLALFGAYIVFTHMVSLTDNDVLVFGTSGAAFLLFVAVTAAIRQSLVGLITIGLVSALLFGLYSGFRWLQ